MSFHPFSLLLPLLVKQILGISPGSKCPLGDPPSVVYMIVYVMIGSLSSQSLLPFCAFERRESFCFFFPTYFPSFLSFFSFFLLFFFPLLLPPLFFLLIVMPWHSSQTRFQIFPPQTTLFHFSNPLSFSLSSHISIIKCTLLFVNPQMTRIINLKYRRQQYPGKGSCKDSCLFIAFIQIIKIIQGGLKNLKDRKVYERERVSYNLALKRQPLLTVWDILVLVFFFFLMVLTFKVYLGIMEKSWFPETLKSLWKYPDSLFGICLKPPIKSGLPQTEHSKYIKRILNLLF